MAEARSWIDTPFHPKAAVKGAGVECGWLIFGVMRDFGLVPPTFQMPEYNLQFWQHTNREIYLEGLVDIGFQEIEGPPLPGDVVVVKMGRVFAHGGWVTDWPKVVHSNMLKEKVVEAHDFRLHPVVARSPQPPKFFTLFHQLEDV